MKPKWTFLLIILAFAFVGCGSYEYESDSYGYENGNTITSIPSPGYNSESRGHYRAGTEMKAASPAEREESDWSEDSDKSYPEDYSKSDNGYIAEHEAGLTPGETPANTTKPADNTETAVQTGREQKIIYIANMILGVYDPDDIKKKVIAALIQLGGFVEEESNLRLVLRVPADNFKIMLEEIIKFGRIISKNIFTQDVTEEFYDLVSRLIIMKDTLVVLGEMLKQAKTKQLQLEILREMRILQEQIERAEARLRYLKDKVSYSTITLDLQLEQQLVQTPSNIKIPVNWLNVHSLESLIR